jgi:hypothetical protein
MGNEMVITDTPWSTELTSPPTAPATVANLQFCITEMASSQLQLQDAHNRQVQTTLNNEYKFARTQDLTLRQATAARSRDDARIEQLMRDKNELTASQMAQGADELRATQQRILAHEAESELQASQAAQHLRHVEATLQTASQRSAAQEQRLDQTHSALHHAQAIANDQAQSQAQALAQHNAHLHAIATAETTARLSQESTNNRRLFDQLTAAATQAVHNADAAAEAANTATARATLQATTLAENAHNQTGAAVNAVAAFTSTHQSLPSGPLFNHDTTATRRRQS